jgi:ketosteroid isomerase-like protein
MTDDDSRAGSRASTGTEIRDERARTFAEGLRRFEQDSDAAAFAGLFADDAVTQRLDARGERRGEVERFWQEYRDQFREVSTTFDHAVEGGDEFALEWTSEATLKNGRPLRYRGVTALGFDDERIVWLRTYYDSAVFAAPAADTA